MPTIIPTTIPEAANFLSTIREFSALDSAGRALVASLMQKQRCEAGHIFFQQDDMPSAVYFIESGKAEVIKHGNYVADLIPTEFFGEMGILEARPRNATVQMTEEGDVFVLPGFLLSDLVRKEPTIEMFLGSVLRERRGN